MALKLLVDPDTDRILGAQGVGKSGVDKRIDVIATAMAGGLTASDLADLELAYAPQFSSAKDPVNMLGYVGDERSQRPHAHDPVARARGGHGRGRDADRRPRSRGEHRHGAIPGSILIPVNELRDRLAEIPHGPVVVHCAVGVRGHTATRILRQLGWDDVRNLDGGYTTWAAGTGRHTHRAGSEEAA